MGVMHASLHFYLTFLHTTLMMVWKYCNM